MNALRVLFDRQIRLIAVAMMLALAMIIPALASAAQVTERSVALSSASKEATGVTYEVKFTTATSATGFVIDFCSNTPLIGQACTPPPGLSVSAATSADSTKDAVETTANKFVGTKTMTTPGAQTITLAGVTNPDDAGTIYARILTFNSNGEQAYESQTPGAYVDDGSVAIAITDTVGVSGAVLETMLFCVASADITKDCANANANAPVLALGETVGDVVALQAGTISTGSLYTQLSTNAASGAVVWLKSNATGCGGLMRFGSSACDIEPALQTGISEGDSKFGVMTAAAATDPSDAQVGETSGTIQAVPASGYNSSTYALNWASGDATGVTSTYGDQFLNTNNLPVNNKNMQLTFGATINNDTPAGLYSADLSLIATGKF
jgi:hypothetical protein